MWLDETEEYIPELPLTGETLHDLLRMARVLREQQAIIQAGNKLIEIEQAHWSDFSDMEEYEVIRMKRAKEYWELYNGMSDDAKEVLDASTKST